MMFTRQLIGTDSRSLSPLLKALMVLVACAALLACDSDSDDSAPGDNTSDALDPGDTGGTDGDTHVPDSQQPDAGDDADTTTPTAPTVRAGATSLTSASDGTLELRHDDDVRLRLPLNALQLGVVPELNPALAYDPVFLEPGAFWGDLWSPPEGLTWLSPESMNLMETDDGWEIELRYPGGRTASVSVFSPGDGRVTLQWKAGTGDPAAYYRIAARASATEGFYGLGEYFDRPEHRGAVRAMNFEPSDVESAYNEAHVPVPFVIGTRGWGLFAESMRPGAFALGVTEDDLVRATFGQGAAWADGLTFHLFTASHPLDVTRYYYETTGYPKLPAPWAYGPLIWRDEVAGQTAVEADFEALRDLDLAASGYWIDRPYASGVNSFDFHPDKYDDPAAMMQKAHAMGFEVALWHTPYIDPDDPSTMALHQEAKDAGYYPPESGASSPNWGPSIDLTNPAAVTFWKEQLSYYMDLGIAGFKLDFAEEHIPGLIDQVTPFEFFDGSDALTMHRRFQFLYHQVYSELLGDAGGLLLVRAGMYGDQTNGVIVWPGDIDATFAHHGEAVTKENGDEYISVGGLPAAVSAGSSLGPSGYPFFGSDTGGYRNSPPSKETYIRWFQHTAFSTCMQVGTNSNDLPWSFGKDKEFDEDLIALYRRYARLHLRLYPYIWSHALDIATTGRAIQRPVGLADPSLGVHPAFDYLLGDDLLVAPILEAGATTRTVVMPNGQWLDFWTGKPYLGGTEYTVDVTLEDIPVFLGEGAIVPLLRDDIDTLNPVDASDIVALAPTGEALHVLLTPPSESSTRTLHDGTVIQTSRTMQDCPVGLRVDIERGTQFEHLTLEIRYALTLNYANVTDGGVALTEVADADALAAAESGWTRLPDTGPAGILVKVPANSADIGIDLWEECPE